MIASGEECIVLDEAPVIGVLVEVAESLLRLKQGAASAEVVDFYGEYKLVFRATGAAIECENEFAGGKCFKLSAVATRDAAKRWSDDLLAGIEEHYTTIKENPHYQRLKVQVVRAWREQASSNWTLPSRPRHAFIANDGELRRFGTHSTRKRLGND